MFLVQAYGAFPIDFPWKLSASMHFEFIRFPASQAGDGNAHEFLFFPIRVLGDVHVVFPRCFMRHKICMRADVENLYTAYAAGEQSLGIGLPLAVYFSILYRMESLMFRIASLFVSPMARHPGIAGQTARYFPSSVRSTRTVYWYVVMLSPSFRRPRLGIFRPTFLTGLLPRR